MIMEKRQIQSNFNIDKDSRTIEGYASVFESESNNIGFIEIIHRGAITNDTILSSDVFAKLNHDDNKILARSKYGKGSLLLEVDDNGLKYMFDAPNTELGNEVLEHIRRGEITSSSFAFTIDKDEKGSEKWYKKDDVIYREIFKIKELFDVSPVFSPAYEHTTCNKRFEEVKHTSDEIDNKMDLIKSELEDL